MRRYSSTIPAMTLSAQLTAGSTSISLSSGSWRTIASPDTLTLVIEPDTANEEIVYVTAHTSGSTSATITRAQESTADITHPSGSVVKHMITGSDLQEAHIHMNASSYATNESVAVHGIGSGEGAVVGTDKTQTLKNKTINIADGNAINGLTVSNVSGIAGTYAPLASPNFTGTPTISGNAIATQAYAQPVDADLTAIAALGTTGILVRTAANTFATRTLVAGTNITLTNADGTGGNIVIAATTSGGTGTVTSVGMTVPTGLSVSGSPITTSGTLAVSLASGYSIPTTSKQTNWDTAYDRSVGYYVSVYTGSALSPTSDGVLTYNSENADSSGFHSTSSNTSRLTVPSNLGGKYKLDAFVNITCGGATGDFTVYLTKNGTEISGTRGKARLSTTGDAQTISVSTIVALAATDYVEVYLDIPGSSGATHSVISGFNANFVGA